MAPCLNAKLLPIEAKPGFPSPNDPERDARNDTEDTAYDQEEIVRTVERCDRSKQREHHKRNPGQVLWEGSNTKGEMTRRIVTGVFFETHQGFWIHRSAVKLLCFFGLEGREELLQVSNAALGAGDESLIDEVRHGILVVLERFVVALSLCRVENHRRVALAHQD